MNGLIPVALYGWVGVAMLLFVALPARRALIATFGGAWILLPPVVLSLPGLPDFSGVMAAALGALAGSMLFDFGRLLSVRPRWFDLPMVAWCAVPFASSLLNDLGAYDGLSHVLGNVLAWGLPYWLGRAYLADAEGLREAAVGVAAAGLACVPGVIFEVATGRLLVSLVYGVSASPVIKYGLPSPRLFMPNALVLASFLAGASAVAYVLWRSGAVRRVAGVPAGLCAAALASATVLAHQTGGVLLMAGAIAFYRVIGLGRVGPGLALATATMLVLGVLPKMGIRVALTLAATLAVIEWARRLRPDRLARGAVLLPVLYVALRSTGLWSGGVATSMAYQFLGQERATSIGYRFANEDILVAHALERPIFGWGGFGRSKIYDYQGVSTIADGLWIIVVGGNGLAGLAALLAVLVLPSLLAMRRWPTAMWTDPSAAPAVALGLMVQIGAVDNLVNAVVSPLLALALGALAGAGGAIRGAPRPNNRPEVSEAEEAEYRARLGGTEALAWRERAASLRGELAARSPDNPQARGNWARALNDLAWMMARDGTGNPARAAELAEHAAGLEPDEPTYWNTLGLAYLRCERWADSAQALEQSGRLGGDAYTGPNELIRALSCRARGLDNEASRHLVRADGWLAGRPEMAAALAGLRAEAAGLSGGAAAPASARE